MVRRKGYGHGKGRGYKNLLPKDPKVHGDSAKGRKQPQKEPKFVPYKNDPEPTFEQSNMVMQDYSEQAMRDKAYLLSDDDSGVAGHRQGIPYYLEEGDIKFDTNAGSEQESVNYAMKVLMDEAGIELNDLKDDMEYSWNADADSYGSFVSGEEEMPEDNLPIYHQGDFGEAELQLDLKEEYDRMGYAKKGMSFKQFEKIMKSDVPNAYDDLYYFPVNYVAVISIPKDKFLKRVKEKGKKLDKEELKIIKEYKKR